MSYKELENALKECIADIEKVLNLLLPVVSTPLDFLQEAMRYSALSTGGHRWRPFVMQQCMGALGCSTSTTEYNQSFLYAAAAVEMIHNASLIHDDLPSIDNDIIRRGVDACHIKFGDGIALLAGNCLVYEAFKVIASLIEILSPIKIAHIIEVMATEAGLNGMMIGQCSDIIAKSNIKCTDEEYQILNNNIFKKTTSLFILPCHIAGIICNANEHFIKSLNLYGYNVGKMYQILDDIEDDVSGLSGLSLKEKIKIHQSELENYADDLADLLKILPESRYRTNLQLLPYYLYERYIEKWSG